MTLLVSSPRPFVSQVQVRREPKRSSQRKQHADIRGEVRRALLGDEAGIHVGLRQERDLLQRRPAGGFLVGNCRVRVRNGREGVTEAAVAAVPHL